MFEDLSLEELFAEADAIGDLYLSDEEIRDREATLLKVRKDIWLSLSDKDLDLL